MSDVVHTARVHAWYFDAEGREVHVTRRDDGKWYLNTPTAEDPIEFVSMETAVSNLAEAHKAGRQSGWVPRLEGGEAFDEEAETIYRAPESKDA